MALELIGALIAAAALGLLAWAARRWAPGLPKWLVPVAAAAGLIGTTVVLEYGWFGRVAAALPKGYVVVDVEEQSMPLRPWTYLWPIRMGFTALDTAATATHPQAAALRMVTLYHFARWKPVEQGLMVVDCANRQRVMVTEGISFAADGTLAGGEWVPASEGDMLQEAACQEG